MRVRQLHYALETTRSAPIHDAEQTTTSSQMRVSIGPMLLVLDTEEQARIVDFERQRELQLDHETRTREEVPLFARVHDRVAGYFSAVHVQKVLAAGGSNAFGQLWQLQAAYGIRPDGEPATPIPERTEDGDETRWSIEGLEIARCKPSEFKLDRRDLARLLAHATHMHPDVARELIATTRIPAELRTQSHFPANMLDQRFSLLDVRDDVELDLDAQLASHPEAPPRDAVHALARRRLDGPRPDHIAAARAAMADKRFVEAQFACMAHILAELDTTTAQSILAEINSRVWRFSVCRRIHDLIELTEDRKQVAKRIASLGKLRSKAGDYQHLLDVFIGEHQNHVGEYDAAATSFGRAVEVDPYLTGPWVSLGRAHISRLEFDRGWQCWDQALRQRPQHSIAQTAVKWCRDLMADFPQFF